MNKSDIIEQIYTDKSFKRVCQNIAPPDMSEDLFQEIICIFLEMSEEKIIKAKQEGYLKFLFVKIATNSYQSKTSPFYKKYRHSDQTSDLNQVVSHTEETNIEFEVKFDKTINIIEHDLKSMNEYERELFKLYVKFGSYRKVSDEVGIKYESVRHAINQAIEKLKQNNEQLFNNLLIQ